MIVCVPTVQHTGSYFVANHLFSDWPKHPIKNAPLEHGVYFDHVWPHKRQWWEELFEETDAIIVPLRHPAVVAESWKRRGRPFREMCDQWRMMRDVIDAYEPSYLPLDVEDRQSYLDAINERYGLSLATSWPVIHSKRQTNEIDWRTFYPDDRTQDLVDELEPLIGRFYK